jgi:uncharacterized membrane protein YcjF (UPF0283 family)
MSKINHVQSLTKICEKMQCISAHIQKIKSFDKERKVSTKSEKEDAEKKHKVSLSDLTWSDKFLSEKRAKVLLWQRFSWFCVILFCFCTNKIFIAWIRKVRSQSLNWLKLVECMRSNWKMRKRYEKKDKRWDTCNSTTETPRATTESDRN